MSNGGQSGETADQLRNFFARLRDEGHAPALAAWVDRLEADGELGEEAANLLRVGERAEIEQELDPGEGGPARVFIFWPPGAG
jgi:hypothetical protein